MFIFILFDTSNFSRFLKSFFSPVPLCAHFTLAMKTPSGNPVGGKRASQTGPGTQPARPPPRWPEGTAFDFTHAHSVSGITTRRPRATPGRLCHPGREPRHALSHLPTRTASVRMTTLAATAAPRAARRRTASRAGTPSAARGTSWDSPAAGSMVPRPRTATWMPARKGAEK